MMTIQQLLEKLEAKKRSIDLAISEIMQIQDGLSVRKKAAKIIESIKPRRKYRKFKKEHWTQTPEGKKKMSALMKAKYASGWKAKGK